MIGKAVKDAAGEGAVFLGPIYDRKTVEALLFYSRVYVHGHSVGGTNPALIQAMAAGCRIVAHDNPFNRQTLADKGVFFKKVTSYAKFFPS